MSKELIALQEKKQKLVNEYRDLLKQTGEDGLLPEAAQTRATEINPIVENLNGQIEMFENTRNWDQQLGAYRPEPTTPTQEDRKNEPIGLNPKEIKGYSITRGLLALGDERRGWGKDPWRNAGLEREVQQEMEKRVYAQGGEVGGLVLPPDLVMGGEKRDLTAAGVNAGKEFVPDILSGSLIELLRARMILSMAGATMMSGLSGDLYIPRQTGSVTAHWVDEGDAIGESEASTDQVPLKPKAIGAYTEYSRRLLIQSSQAVEAFVRNDLVSTLARGIERAAFQGAGGLQPTGLATATGTTPITLATAGLPTFAEMVEFETALNADDADIGRLSYIMPGAARGHLKTTPRFSGGEIPIWSDRNTVNAYNAYASNLIDKLSFGNWLDMIIGLWGSMEITVDPYGKMERALFRVVAIQEVDVALRHPQSFAREA